MNRPQPQHPWERLVAAARKVQDDRDTSAPYGFAARVAALAMIAEHRSGSVLLDRLALRALGVACLLALGSIALNYQALTAPDASPVAVAAASEEQYVVSSDDPVAIVLDLAD